MIARKLRQDGIGASVKHTPIVNHLEEVPAFTGGNKQLSQREVELSHQLSKVRINVE